MTKQKRRALRMPRSLGLGDLDWDEMNLTELVQLAQFNEIPGASMGVPRPVLIHALKNMEPIGDPPPMDKIRSRYSAWLRRHWSRVRLQMKKGWCPDCFQSCDVQVAKCWIRNRDQVGTG